MAARHNAGLFLCIFYKNITIENQRVMIIIQKIVLKSDTRCCKNEKEFLSLIYQIKRHAMRNKIYYEWAAEEIDEDGDILDSSFYGSLSDVDKSDFNELDIALVYNEGNEANGLEDRLWAYIKDGKLPDFFSDGAGHETSVRVPQKFHKELQKYLVSN